MGAAASGQGGGHAALALGATVSGQRQHHPRGRGGGQGGPPGGTCAGRNTGRGGVSGGAGGGGGGGSGGDSAGGHRRRSQPHGATAPHGGRRRRKGRQHGVSRRWGGRRLWGWGRGDFGGQAAAVVPGCHSNADRGQSPLVTPRAPSCRLAGAHAAAAGPGSTKLRACLAAGRDTRRSRKPRPGAARPRRTGAVEYAHPGPPALDGQSPQRLRTHAMSRPLRSYSMVPTLPPARNKVHRNACHFSPHCAVRWGQAGAGLGWGHRLIQHWTGKPPRSKLEASGGGAYNPPTGSHTVQYVGYPHPSAYDPWQ